MGKFAPPWWIGSPNGTCSGRIKWGFVIDLERARKRLRPGNLETSPTSPAVKALALADEFQKLLDEGTVKRRADLARRFNFSRARVTQLLDLHRLHPDIQDFVRTGGGSGQRELSVRRLRSLCSLPHHQQLSELRKLCSEFSPAAGNKSAVNTMTS